MADTEVLIQQALKAEEAERKLQKQQKHDEDKARKASRKGKTLEQIESEEGGPVKESMVGMAQSKRAAKRKGGAKVEDTDLVQDVEGIEEDLEQEEEDGIKLEAFNLKEEREKGYFDDSGNYVEREDKDAEEDARDAWLQSGEANVVSDEVRRKIQAAQRKAAEDEAAAGPMSATQIARLQFQASQLLQPGESVAAALKRLGGHSRRPAKRSRRGGDQPSDMAADVSHDPAAKEQFNKLTEAAMQLMDAGENDVYSQNKEYFERAAAVYIDLPGSSKVPEGPSTAAYEEADEDMFASDEERKEPQAAAAAAAGAAAAVGAGSGTVQQLAPSAGGPPAAGGPPQAASGPPAKAAAADATDYSSWPVKELRRFLAERGVDGAGIVDKTDLVAKVKQAAAAGPEGAAPEGYIFDAATGYYLSADTGMYWDPASGGFYNGGDGKWYSWDGEKKEFVEWKQ
ncbi:hypothetical protein D9Q98_010127 [Chlorella vulgaris]|uniref:OCRE domain-containing protein n=1 Tax=Chlorella vulgaris TaxID=3077 RepID=A0A9D4TMR6_CHLVU|nr:hypothetical protein D9Q98_010127 [Chlorella vulgaris]